MSTLTVFQYILLVILILFTLVNFYAFTFGRKRSEQGKALYRQTLNQLHQKALTEMKRHGISFEEQRGYLNDLNEGILLAFDTKKKIAGIVLKDSFFHFPYENLVSCTRQYDTLANKKITHVRVIIETTDEYITLLFGSRSYKPNSFLGKFILEDSQEFCTILTESCAR
ncbi:MAG: hypothetical protein GX911_00415 [Spirochaetales bacterium]|nr:hypothetical protein [Spirochaetales bacterium]